MNEKQQPYVVPEHVSRTLGKDAQRNNILAARIIADIVKTTLGPKGMDKMLVDSAGNITVTNDGVTILQEMEIDHPAAKLIIEVARSQEQEVGDGTTTAALLSGKLLEHAEKLLDRRIHPTTIIKGYRLAAEKAKIFLNELAVRVSEPLLKQIAMTSMTGKGAEGNREAFAEIIVNAVKRVAHGGIDSEAIKLVKQYGEAAEKSELIDGIVVDKEVAHQDMPRAVKDASIALVDFPLEVRAPELETRVSVTTPEQLQHFIDNEERTLKMLTQKIADSGARVVFCQKGIDDVAQYYLARAGILGVRRVPKSDMEKLAKATSGKIVSNVSELEAGSLGYAALVEEIRKGDDAMTYVRGCRNPKAVTILIRGSSMHVVDEIERAFKDGLGVVAAAATDEKAVAGGGAIEISLARKLREFARTLSGREQLAVEEFAHALESVPETLAENAGLDTIEIITELRRRHASGNVHEGLNLFKDTIEDCLSAGIVEPMRVKTQAIASATEVATMILRIDDVLVSSGKPQSQRQTGLEGMD